MKRIFFLFLILFIFQNVQAENLGLSEAYENEIVERVKSVFQTKEVKEEVERPICATPIFLEIRHNWDRFSAKTRAVLESYFERPTYNFEEHTYDTPQGHFKIHYVTQGDSAVPNEDWVNTCGEVLEHVWDAEIDSLGYNQPPSDDWYPDNGGDGKYDVYLLSLDPAILGYSVQDSFLPSHPTSITSYIVLDHDYLDYGSLHTQLEWLQVTAAHEFFHAIQFGYDGTEYEVEGTKGKFYWMEMSAVWMEDMVYDDVNDYLGYLSSFFDHPEWSLKTFGDPFLDPPDVVRHAYGSCVWPIFLSEKFGTLIIKDIWEKCAEVPGDNVFDPPSPDGKSATDKALEAWGSNFEDVFREFTVWNYFTADRAITHLFYSEGDLFPVKVQVDAIHTEYPVYVDSIPHPPENLGSNYVVFIPEEKQGGLNLTFWPTTGDYQISAVGYNENVYEPLVQRFQVNQQTGYAETDIYNWASYNEIIMIPAVTSKNADSFFVYTYAAEYDSSLHGEHPFPQTDYIGQNFPNPFVINGSSDSTYFPFILSSVSEMEIYIFTVSGELVWHYPPPEKEGKEWTIGDYTKRGRCPAWDGRTEEGKYVTSGIYLYQVKTKNSRVIKKMAVIR